MTIVWGAVYPHVQRTEEENVPFMISMKSHSVRIQRLVFIIAAACLPLTVGVSRGWLAQSRVAGAASFPAQLTRSDRSIHGETDS